jgi:AcrR family transcriptional regulator
MNSMKPKYVEVGRVNQKRRTRQALVAAATDLVRSGATPTVAEVADAAGVSRTTAYRYFPTQEALLVNATTFALLSRADGHLERIARAASKEGSVTERVDAVVRGDDAMTLEAEASLRSVLRASLAPEVGADPRPAFRERWFGAALEPIRGELGERRYARLVAALGLCCGIEARVVTKDVYGLGDRAGLDVKRWAAETLVHGALEEARASSKTKRT